jgi:SAM-dependent methyltransferase
MTDPAKFENISSFIFQDAELFLSKMIKEMTWKKYHERVLDYGCGAGKTGFNQILPQVYLHDSHLYSVDISEDMVAYASMKYPHSCVTYAIGDIMSENYPFKYIKFDKIFCTFVLEFIKDYE